MKIVDNHPFSSRGSILVFLAVILVAAIGVIALLIDHSRDANSAKDLQSAVDAAALAGATVLDSSKDGWLRVKPAVLSALSKNSVLGAESQFPSDIVLSGAPLDSLDSSAHVGTTGSRGDWELVVERGWYGWDAGGAGNGKYEFRSLEGQQALTSSVLIPGYMGLPVYSFANAVKVTLHLKKIPATLGKTYAASVGQIKRSSIALTNRKLDECIAPFAIPACELMLNTQSDSSTYDNSGYDADMACERELVFSEANYEGNYFRLQGITRSDSYPRPPYRNGKLNRRAMPIHGILGLPEGSTALASVSPDKVGEFFRDFANGVARDGCDAGVRAKIGGRFKPVDQLVQPLNPQDADGDGVVDVVPAAVPGFYDNPQVEAAIGTYINSSNLMFRDAFPSGSRNRPQLRTTKPGYIDPDAGLVDEQVELRINWPTEHGGLGNPCVDDGTCNDYAGELILGDMLKNNPAAWTNPMCHSKQVNYADFPGAGAKGARARRVKVAVIAPEDAAATPYCDWDSVFAGRAQSSYLPEGSTNPVIVGFVEVDLFDFNIMLLSAVDGAGKPKYHDGNNADTAYFEVQDGPAGPVLSTIEDRNPVGIKRVFDYSNGNDFLNQLGSFLTDQISLDEQTCLTTCMQTAGCDPTTCVTTGALIGRNQVPYLDYLKCYDFMNLGLSAPIPIVTIFDSMMTTSYGISNLHDPRFCQDPTREDSVNNVGLLMFYLSGGLVKGVNINFYLDILQKLTQTPAPQLIYDSTDATTERSSARRVAQVLKNAETQQAGRCQMLLGFLDMAFELPDDLVSPYAKALGPNDPTADTSTGPNRSQLHCLPWKRDNAFDLFDPASWDDPTPLAPQYGCGGLRARLRCNDPSTGIKRSFIAPDGAMGATPILVD